jgi:hypothetical protein
MKLGVIDSFSLPSGVRIMMEPVRILNQIAQLPSVILVQNLMRRIDPLYA